jgi:hypothetical protein
MATTNVTTKIGQFNQPGISAVFAAISANSITFGDNTTQKTAVSSWQAAVEKLVPYTGATGDVNLATHELTAFSISANAITSSSLSAITVSAGATRVAAITFGDNTTQTTASIPGSGNGVPYVGATSNLNLGVYGLIATSASIPSLTSIIVITNGLTSNGEFALSGADRIITIKDPVAAPPTVGYHLTVKAGDAIGSGPIGGNLNLWAGSSPIGNSGVVTLSGVRIGLLAPLTSNTSISSTTISTGATRVASITFGDGTTQATAGSSQGVPYSGATADVNLGVYTLSANSLITNGLTSNGEIVLSGGDRTITINPPVAAPPTVGYHLTVKAGDASGSGPIGGNLNLLAGTSPIGNSGAVTLSGVRIGLFAPLTSNTSISSTTLSAGTVQTTSLSALANISGNSAAFTTLNVQGAISKVANLSTVGVQGVPILVLSNLAAGTDAAINVSDSANVGTEGIYRVHLTYRPGLNDGHATNLSGGINYTTYKNEAHSISGVTGATLAINGTGEVQLNLTFWHSGVGTPRVFVKGGGSTDTWNFGYTIEKLS